MNIDRKLFAQFEKYEGYFYSIDNIKKANADVNFIYGRRGPGKTTSLLIEILEQWIKEQKQGFIIRRYEEDFQQGKGAQQFETLVRELRLVEKLTNGEWTDITWHNRMWYLSRVDKKGKKELQERPFCFSAAMTKADHYKSISYPDVYTILVDEFMPDTGTYLYDEWTKFKSICITIMRQRPGVKIYLCGNTTSLRNNPYINNFGLKHVKYQKQGTIDLYTTARGLKIAVEYTLSNASAYNQEELPNDKFWCFDDEKPNMDVGGDWAFDVYPTLGEDWKKIFPENIVFKYFIIFEDETLQCEIVEGEYSLFTYIHQKTTPIKDPDNDLVFTMEYSQRPNYKRKLFKPTSNIERKLLSFFEQDRVFYQDNNVGDIVNSYKEACLLSK